MAEMANRHELTGQEIRSIISTITDMPEQCGFEVYVITKSEPQLKKMGFAESGPNNLKKKLKQSILNVLSEKYNSEEAVYVSVDRIADEQRRIYIIPASENYDPLAVLRTGAGVFSNKDVGDATGIAFLISNGEKRIWAYQHLWSIMIPNKSRKNLLAKLVSSREGDVFEEMTEPIITFAEKIDLLMIDENIITPDYRLLQNSFGFQEYIKIRADKTITAIEDKGIVSNIDKLRNYVKRGNGKTKYAKKMMRITDSKVLKMDPDALWENIHHSSRWNGKIKEENGKFVLDTYVQVEYLIDLLDERYTRSDITGEEYDTEVKHIAEPAIGE